MIKQSELEVMVCDLFVDAYRAGSSGAEHTYGAARNGRAKLIEAIMDLYAELEQESYKREQLEAELLKANEIIAAQKDEIKRRMKLRLSKIYGNKLTDPENPDSPLWSDYEPTEDDIPDDGGKFSEQDLPFPDVDVCSPASELEGSDE